MSDIPDAVGTVETIDVAAELDALDVVELGDAIEETKQSFLIPIFPDSQHVLGWLG